MYESLISRSYEVRVRVKGPRRPRALGTIGRPLSHHQKSGPWSQGRLGSNNSGVEEKANQEERVLRTSTWQFVVYVLRPGVLIVLIAVGGTR